MLNKQTIYGYPLEDLLAFALACRQQGISNNDLSDFVNNLEFAFDVIETERNRILEEQLKQWISE